MPKERESQQNSDADKEPFITIDDLLQQAETLTDGLRTLSEYRRPLDIRRGVGNREEVSDMPENAESRIVKAGARTYFFDIKQTKEDKPFLVITESRFKGEGEERERSSITVFPEQAEEFGQAVTEMTTRLE